MTSKMMRGTSILMGDSTIPGVEVPEELRKILPDIFKAAHDFGLDFYPTVIEFLTYDEISEIAAYGGFPVRYPHWKWGMEYNELQQGYEHGMQKIYEMVVNCCDLKTKVLTKRGTIYAGDVLPGDQMVLGDQVRDVVSVKRQLKKKVLRVKIAHYSQDLVCTLEHRWKKIGENGLEWVEAKDLKNGDILVGMDNYCGYLGLPYKISWDPDKVLSETRSNIRHCIKNIQIPKEMTVDLAELLGIIVGDGTCGTGISSKNQVSVAVGLKYKSYAKHIAELFKSVFKKSAVIRKKPRCYHVVFCSKLAIDFFDHIGLKKGCTYKTKRVPYCIWLSSQEFRASFLRGLFDTDGYSSGGLGVSGYNFDLIADVQLLLSEMGIVSKIKTVANNGYAKNNCISVLEITAKSGLRRFEKYIGFYLEYKNDYLRKLINTQYCRSRGIHVPYVQNEIIKWAEKNNLTTYNDPSLGRSIKNMRKGLVGLHSLFSFVERAGDSMDKEILNTINLPMYEVEGVCAETGRETVDISLSHKSHDFIANGIISHNCNPCYIYCLDSNTLVDNVTVVAHALGHNDFFKNNVYFAPTSQNMMNELANHGSRIRKYMQRWGKEKVVKFLDHVLRIATLIDPAKAWEKRRFKEPVIIDKRNYRYPKRLDVKDDHDYMDTYLNPEEWIEKQKKDLDKKEIAEQLQIFKRPIKDVMQFIRDNAPLQPWQADIVAMLYEEEMYFSPQRITHTLNEGYASFVDFNLMAKRGFASLGQKEHDAGIIEYSIHKMGVLGGKYSMNPYKLGFCLFQDIEDRWNKGQFGPIYDDCKNLKQREDWDENVGLGHDKVLEVRKFYDDFTFISEFFTEDFCNKYEFFEWEHRPNGEYVIKSRDYKQIKKKLMENCINGGLPDVRLVDPNHLNRGHMLLEHQWDGHPLYPPYVKAVLQSLKRLWGQNREVVLVTKDKDEQEIVYHTRGTEVMVSDRHDYESYNLKG